MIHPLTVRVSVLAMSIAVAISAHASVNAVTDTVKGRPATVSNATITNQSAPGLNPAQGDVLEVTYDYSDPDALPEDKTLSVYGWMADGSAAGEPLTGDITFVPGASQLEKFLTVQVTAAESAPSDPDRATMVESAPTGAPVLPPRSEFESLYHFSSGAHMRWGDAYMYCANRNERLMTTGELQELFVDFTRATSAPAAENNGDLSGTYGVGLNNVAWAATGRDSYHDYVYIATDGHISSNSNATTVEVVCARFGGAEGLPTVTNVNIQGEQKVGSTLTVDYIYNGNDTIPDRIVEQSGISWLRSGNETADGPAIPGANGKTYALTPEDEGQYITVMVVPASYDTVVGTAVKAKTGQIQPTEQPFPSGTTLEANGYDFGIDSGFPTTGFTQARFQVQISGNASNNSGYTWSTDQSWATVDNNGTVTFTSSAPVGNKALKITASNNSATYSKTINLNKWFINSGADQISSNYVSSYCSNLGADPNIRVYELTNGSYGGSASRNIGSLWPEWGSAGFYSGSGFSSRGYWTTDNADSTNKYWVDLDDGAVGKGAGSLYAVCVKTL